MNELKKVNRIRVGDRERKQMRVVLNSEKLTISRKRKQRDRDYFNSF